jgi:hypothetical protein
MKTVHLISDSREYDAALVSLADAAVIGAKLRKWFVVGGHMVNLHILRVGLDAPLRLTHDADLAVEIRMIRRGTILEKLRDLGYRNRTYPNRFDRELTPGGPVASIDLVVASYSTKHVPNMDADEIVVDGMPVIDEALDLEPVHLHLIGDRSDGVRMEMDVRIPDIMSAIAMKSFAVAERPYVNDAVDLAYLLEVAHADGSTKWPRGKAYQVAAVQLAAQFDLPGTALALATADPTAQARLRELTRSLSR